MKTWNEEYGVDENIDDSKRFKYRPLTIRSTWKEFYEQIFSSGVRYDPRYDRRVVWEMIKIGNYVDRNGRLMDPNPLILADTSVCLDYCTDVKENFPMLAFRLHKVVSLFQWKQKIVLFLLCWFIFQTLKDMEIEK